MAKTSGGKVTALYVADTGKYTAPAGEVSFNIADEVFSSIRGAALEEGKKATQHVEDLGKAAGVAVEKKVIEGNPAEAIMTVAESGPAEVIVIGNIGRTGIERFLLGSVADKIVRHSKIPVLVVKGD